VFPGAPRWLEVLVRADTGNGCAIPGGYTTLSPRQPVTPAPYSITAANATQLGGQSDTLFRNATNLNSGTIPSGRLSGSYTGTLNLSNAANTFAGNGGGSEAVTVSAILNADLGSITLGGDLSGSLANAQIAPGAVAAAELAIDTSSFARVSGGAASISGATTTFAGPVLIPTTTRTDSIPGVAFVPGESGYNFSTLNGARILAEGEGGGSGMIAPLNLPHGATVTNVTAFDSANDMTIQYLRLSNTGLQSFDSGSSDGSGGNTTFQVCALSGAINNTTNTYSLRALWNETTDGTTRFRLYRVQVDYAVTVPLP